MKIKKKIKSIWKKNPIELIKMIFEIIIIFGFITYLSFKQTNISERQLELQENQQTILENQTLIFNYEHKPKFRIVEYINENDSSSQCLTESIKIYNDGYPIDNIKTKVFSFYQIETEKRKTTIFPVAFYYSTSIINQESTGVLETYTHLWNCKTFFSLRDELINDSETYHWNLNKIHIIQIEWTDVLDESHISYFSTNVHQPNQELDEEFSLKYIRLYKQEYIINIQDKIDIEILKKKVRNKTYNKI